MLFRENIPCLLWEPYEHSCTLCGQKVGFYMLDQVVHIATTGLYSVNVKDNLSYASRCVSLNQR
jgi:hypothetical protein